MKRRLLSILLTLVLTLALLPAGVLADVSVHLAGSGTEDEPYKIYTANDLKAFRDIVNGGNYSVCAVLENDIVLNDGTFDENGNYTPGPSGKAAEKWTPIAYEGVFYGNPEKPGYSGTFDGQGHTIYGLYVNVPKDNTYYFGYYAYLGLFSTIENAAIKNVTVTGYVVSGLDGALGGIVGDVTNSTIENCGNQCDVISESELGHIGGIAGFIVSASVSGCYNTGKINGAGTRGGIIGTTRSGTIRDCYNTGAVIGDPESGYVGGIVGFSGTQNETGTPDISNCYNVGTVTGMEPVGGIVDWNYGTVRNCFFLDSVAGVAIGKNFPEYNGTVTDVEAKSETEFADGTVLKKLKDGERGSSTDPWDDTCRLVPGTDMYLPVFKYQDSYEPAPTPEPVTGPSGSRFSYSTISASAGENGTVSPSGNLSVRDDLSQTFVFTPDKGYRVKDVLIDGQSVGALRSYTFATVRKNRTVEVIFEKIPAFVDVPSGSYYEDAVNWAVENWITEGTDDTHFSPDAPCTRAQAVTFLWRAAGCPAPASYTMPFADVKSGSYYETAVLWALENGIVSGTSETTFEPDAVCTRAQIVCFLFRYKAANGMDAVTLAELLGGYTDSAEIPAYARPALNWALSANVLQGSGTKLLPNEACTRAQIVTLLYRTIR